MLLIKLSGDVPVNNLFINKPIPEKIINSNPWIITNILLAKTLENKCILGLTFDIIISILLVVFSSQISPPTIWTKNTTSIKNGNITVGKTLVITIFIFSSILALSLRIVLSTLAGAEIFASISGFTLDLIIPMVAFDAFMALVISWYIPLSIVLLLIISLVKYSFSFSFKTTTISESFRSFSNSSFVFDVCSIFIKLSSSKEFRVASK